MKTWQLVLVGIGIHMIFFYSIFDIYFTSPIVHGMYPYLSPRPPPAKRLVLFSADGLRADKMFELDDAGRTRTPFLREVMETQGAWGVSHTRVPTESRPGHVAMIAGLYEDVSAVAKGWKDNPVEFDSVFNASRYTWSWGSPDILPMFAKGATGGHVFMHCYPASFEDFGAGGDVTRLDTWVFDEFKKFFARSYENVQLTEKLHQDKTVFFLHLLGLDTNGHSRKPYSREYLDNIRLVDHGIREIVELIESYFNHDGGTAYLMTADHGMTDWGSHGAGHPSETLTPLVVWGAGVRGPIGETTKQYADTFSDDWNLAHLKRRDVEQADIAPLMSALIGVNYPRNSVGTLPSDLLNVSAYNEAEMMFANTQQILAQYQVKMELKKSTTLSFAFRPFSELTASKVVDVQRHVRQLIQTGHYTDAIAECRRVMQVALRGLNYYQTYDRFFLGTSIFCGYLGWMAYILTLILERHSGIVRPKVKVESIGQPFWKSDKGIMTAAILIGGVISVLLFVQSLPWTNYLYCLTPVVLWMVVAQRYDVLRQTMTSVLVMANKGSILLEVLCCFVGLEVLVLGFFQREVLSVGLVGMAVLPLLNTSTSRQQGRRGAWFVACLSVAIFPLLPVVTGKKNCYYIIFGGMFAIATACICVSSVAREMNYNRKVITTYWIQMMCLAMATYLAGYDVNYGLSTSKHVLSWLMLGLSFVGPLFGPLDLKGRLLSIILSFLPPFILLSVSYEVLFVACLAWLLYEWLLLECHMTTATAPQNGNILNNLYPHKASVSLESLHFGSVKESFVQQREHLVASDIRRAFFFVYLILTAFFGTGNIASVNSFDPAAVLCFVSVFNPFIMGALLLFKIVIPFLLVACALQAVHVVTRVPVQALFLLVLLMSDTMALHFFFLVRDSGSWLDIGTSISHYVIVMSMIMFVILLFGISHVLTTVQLPIYKWKRS